MIAAFSRLHQKLSVERDFSPESTNFASSSHPPAAPSSPTAHLTDASEEDAGTPASRFMAKLFKWVKKRKRIPKDIRMIPTRILSQIVRNIVQPDKSINFDSISGLEKVKSILKEDGE